MSDRVTVQITEGVADVRLNRPDKLNALDGDMFVALVDVSARLARGHVGAGGRAVRRGAGLLGRPRLLGVHGHGRRPGHGRHGRTGRAGRGRWVERRRRGRQRRHRRHRPHRRAHHAPRAAGRPRVVRGPGTGHRRGVGPLPRRWAADRPRRRPAPRPPRRHAVRARDPLGAVARHDGHRNAAPAGGHRRRQGADVDRPERVGHRGRGARPVHPREPTIRWATPWPWPASSRPRALRRSGARSACSTSRAWCRSPSSTPTSATRSRRSSARPTRSRRWPPTSRSGRPPSPTPTESAEKLAAARRAQPVRCSSAARWCWWGWPTAAIDSS